MSEEIKDDGTRPWSWDSDVKKTWTEKGFAKHRDKKLKTGPGFDAGAAMDVEELLLNGVEKDEITETVLAGGIKSSGEKRDFGTGAQRDSNIKNPKGRMDLIPAVAMSRFANFLCFTRAIIDKEHSLYCYNSAMSSMYAWLEGDRLSGDMPNNVMKGGRPICTFDHLSNVLLNVQDMMHMDDDIPLWYPKTSPDYDLKPPRYDKISPLFLKRVSIHYQLGGINYGNRNWELGMPVMVTWDSACRHLTNWLEHETTEDHLAAIGWNIMCTMHTIEMLNRGVIKDPEGDMHTAPYYYYQDIPAKMYAPKPVRLFDKRDFEFEMGNDDINDFDEDFDEPETARDALRGK